MIISVRRLSRLLRLLVMVCLFSFICFKVLGLLQELIEPANRYREPVGGDARKVDAVHTMAGATPAEGLLEELLARLSVFYKIGE